VIFAPIILLGCSLSAPKPNTVALVPATPPVERWQGDACNTNADCGWDDQCFPKECLANTLEVKQQNCEESAPPPGSCSCVKGACTLRPEKPKASEGTCRSNIDCSLRQSLGQCEVSSKHREDHIGSHGPYCACNGGSCEFGWVDVVPCQSNADCWYEAQPVLHPTRATKPRPLPFEPCVDGEIDSVCRGAKGQKSCMVVPYDC
jgi:hypothetical protein